MYERFTDCAKKVLMVANSEAQRFNRETIGSEHVLLALLKINHGVAASILSELDVDTQKVSRELEDSLECGPDFVHMGKLPLAPEMRTAMQLALDEAHDLNHRYVGTQHLLLGLFSAHEGAPSPSELFGVPFEELRARVSEMGESAEQLAFPDCTPGDHIRLAIKAIWDALPQETRNTDEVQRKLREFTENAWQEFLQWSKRQP